MPIARRKPKAKLLPDGKHLVSVISIVEAEQLRIKLANQTGYTSLWLDIDEHGAQMLYNMLHCAGKTKVVYSDGEQLKAALVGCKLNIQVLNNQVVGISKIWERVLL